MINAAAIPDVPHLVTLINSAYRGEFSKKGWTTEADLLAGEKRTDIATLSKLITAPGAIMLKYETGEKLITGCVYLQKQDRGLYLGMLTVSPELQAAGIGKQLLLAAELYAKNNECPVIFMNVISLRTELIEWYTRRGYCLTGEKKPLPDDKRFGIPTQPIEFAIMEKIIPA